MEHATRCRTERNVPPLAASHRFLCRVFLSSPVLVPFLLALPQVAEELYQQGLISYPRTETDAYPDSMDLRVGLTLSP